MLFLDQKLVGLALKKKNFLVLDLSFEAGAFPEFRSHCERQYMHLPGYRAVLPGFASGLASQGYLVLIYGAEFCELPDPTLNVKWLTPSQDASWSSWDEQIRVFGPGLVLIPAKD